MREFRAATLSTYVEVATYLGLDPYRMLREAGIAPAVLEDLESRLPARAVIDLMERSASASGCPNFGLMLAECRPFAALGPVCLLFEHLPTVRDVVEAAIAYQRHLNDVVLISLEETAVDTALIKIDLAPEFAKRQAIDFALGVCYITFSGASGGRWSPSAIHVTHGAPDELTIWSRMYQVPVHFDSAFNGFVSSKSMLAISNPHANSLMAQHARRLLKLVEVPAEMQPVSDKVRQTIMLLLPGGVSTLKQIAGHLGRPPRALQRSLEEEGQTFAGLLSEVRRELAQHYLAGSSQSITAIAEQLGYSSLSAFTRWFVREFGVPPQVWRKAQRTVVGSPPPIWKL